MSTQIVTVTFSSPTVTGFVVPASPYSGATVACEVTATGTPAVAFYAVTADTTDAPTTWQASGTFSVTLDSGTHILRAYAKDTDGTISAPVAQSITIALAGDGFPLMYGTRPCRVMRGTSPVTLRYGTDT